MLRVANCEYIDDWTLGKIGGMMPTLEMLDISGCHRVSAKGEFTYLAQSYFECSGFGTLNVRNNQPLSLFSGLMGLVPLKKLNYLRLEGFDEEKVSYIHFVAIAGVAHYLNKEFV